MNFLDLTLPIFEGMPVYPGDPEVELEQVQTFEKDEWNMKRIHMNGHDGTHVNTPIHCTKNGKTLDDYTIEDFCGACLLYKEPTDLNMDKGLIFADQNITMELAKAIIKAGPPFIGLSSAFEFDEEVEKYLLENEIICFERIANTEKLPQSFYFHGAPLSIVKGDGSPIRAYAVF